MAAALSPGLAWLAVPCRTRLSRQASYDGLTGTTRGIEDGVEAPDLLRDGCDRPRRGEARIDDAALRLARCGDGARPLHLRSHARAGERRHQHHAPRRRLFPRHVATR